MPNSKFFIAKKVFHKLQFLCTGSSICLLQQHCIRLCIFVAHMCTHATPPTANIHMVCIKSGTAHIYVNKHARQHQHLPMLTQLVVCMCVCVRFGLAVLLGRLLLVNFTRSICNSATWKLAIPRCAQIDFLIVAISRASPSCCYLLLLQLVLCNKQHMLQ